MDGRATGGLSQELVAELTLNLTMTMSGVRQDYPWHNLNRLKQIMSLFIHRFSDLLFIQ